MQERFDRLESLVLDALGRSKPQSQNLANEPADGQQMGPMDQANGPGSYLSDRTMGILGPDSAGRHLYSGETAWNTILHEISDIKSSCSESTRSRHYEYETSHKERLGSRQSISILDSHIEGLRMGHADILHQLPPKVISDQLLSMFFDIYSPTMPYWNHLGTLTATGAVWLSLVYSMMCITLRFYGSDQQTPTVYQDNPHEHAETFYQLAAQALNLADVNHPVKGTIEAQSLFLHAGPSYDRKDITRTWLTAGDVVRLAMRMGYHRDPSQYSDLSPFEGEMRRRVWNFIYQTDLLFSFQLGLPPAVRGREYDTMITQNVCEQQLAPRMSAPPSPLPGTEATHISYMVAQNPVFRVFGDIVENLNTIQPHSYSTTLELDSRLSEAFAATPRHLKRSLPDSSTDPPPLVLERIELELFYHKVKCILHRRYLTTHYPESTYDPSRHACVTSALRLLECQSALHNNRRWPHVKWWTSSLHSHDFILAATILCLYLSTNLREGATYQDAQGQQFHQALRQSFAIWTDVRESCVDAEKAFMIFDSLRRQHPGILTEESQKTTSSNGHSLTVAGFTEPALTSPSLFFGDESTEFPRTIDWDLWDSYFRDVEPLPVSPHPEVSLSDSV